MRTAHVILFLDITGPQPVAVRAGVRSSGAGSLTQTDRRLVILDVLQAPGKNYESAERGARCTRGDRESSGIRLDPPPYGGALDLSGCPARFAGMKISVSNGKYTFVKSPPIYIKILRYGQPWLGGGAIGDGIDAIISMMAELDAARVVLEAARQLGDAAPPEIKRALERHRALVDDREAPSEWAQG